MVKVTLGMATTRACLIFWIWRSISSCESLACELFFLSPHISCVFLAYFRLNQSILLRRCG
jgi:hypothetical protein